MSKRQTAKSISNEILPIAAQGCVHLPPLTNNMISAVIPTFNRPRDLEITLLSICSQSSPPMEVIVVDDSTDSSTNDLVESMVDHFAKLSIRLVYIRNTGERGLVSSRNAGVKASNGEIILFLDDDVSLEGSYLETIMRAFECLPDALGIQGFWASGVRVSGRQELLNGLFAVFRLFHFTKTDCEVLPSFEPTYPLAPNEIMNCQWLSGCNQSYRKSVFAEVQFDENLRRYAPGGEDIDFSYRVFKAHPRSLYIVREARLIHRGSPASRPPPKNLLFLRAVYKHYLFRKNIEQSLRNKIVYYWSVLGRILLLVSTRLVHFGRLDVGITMNILAPILSEVFSLSHHEEITQGKLDFLGVYLDY